jgi:hypothetical protein
MNIGKWIIVAFVLFAAFIATLVTICVRQDISLVSKNYYKEELQYQARIIQENNTSSLKEKPTLSIKSNHVEVAFHEHTPEKGELVLFCPGNEKMDRSFDLKEINTSPMSFDIANLQKGMYRARLQWTMNGKEYYQEEIIYL